MLKLSYNFSTYAPNFGHLLATHVIFKTKTTHWNLELSKDAIFFSENWKVLPYCYFSLIICLTRPQISAIYLWGKRALVKTFEHFSKITGKLENVAFLYSFFLKICLPQCQISAICKRVALETQVLHEGLRIFEKSLENCKILRFCTLFP